MAHITLPGPANVHTHLRVPGGQHKENFATGTAAAPAGGLTTILAMPNTSPPLSTQEIMQATRQRAQPAIYCDVGFFAGAGPERVGQLRICPRVPSPSRFISTTRLARCGVSSPMMPRGRRAGSITAKPASGQILPFNRLQIVLHVSRGLYGYSETP